MVFGTLMEEESRDRRPFHIRGRGPCDRDVVLTFRPHPILRAEALPAESTPAAGLEPVTPKSDSISQSLQPYTTAARLRLRICLLA